MEKRHRDRWREAKRPFHIDWFFSSTLSYLACPTVPSPDETKEEPIFGIASQLEVAFKEIILLPHFSGRATFIPTRLPPHPMKLISMPIRTDAAMRAASPPPRRDHNRREC